MDTKNCCCKCNVILNPQNQYKEAHYEGVHYMDVCNECLGVFISEYFLEHNEFPPCADMNCLNKFCSVCPNGNKGCTCKYVEMAFKYPIETCYSCGGLLEADLYQEEHAGHQHVYGICCECIEVDLPYYIACRDTSVICYTGTKYGEKMYPCNMLINISLSEEIQQASYKISESWEREIRGQKQLLESIRRFKEVIDNKGPWKNIDMFKRSMVDPKLRPCPMCGTFIRHTHGCWRMNCPSCYHSFWFPTGEDWDSFSSEKQSEYGGKERDWWLDVDKLEYYWLDWFPTDLKEELKKQLHD